MKPFNYPQRLRLLREGVDAEVADFVFGAKDLTYAQIAVLFSCSVDRIKTIAGRAGTSSTTCASGSTGSEPSKKSPCRGSFAARRLYNNCEGKWGRSAATSPKNLPITG